MTRPALKRGFLIGGAVLALCSAVVVAQDAPRSLLPPGFDDPKPAPSPAPAATRASAPPSAAASSSSASRPVVQPIPGATGAAPVPAAIGPIPSNLPSLAEIEKLQPDELDELLGLKPKFDIPPAARRSTERVGILGSSEGGLSSQSLARQPATIVRASLAGINGPMVSRWGHIMMRRALASRLASPAGMDPVEFAALRAKALNRIGEYSVARAIAQDVDTANWNDGLTDAALDAYIATTDIVGACPIVQQTGGKRDDPQWQMLQSICYAFNGQEARSQSNLNRAFRSQDFQKIDVLLAQRYAGAAGRGRRAVNLEWTDVKALTPWRFSLATALGAEVPKDLLDKAGDYYRIVAATNPAMPLVQRAAGADIAARRGIISSSALVDFYSELHAEAGTEGPAAQNANRLREAYVAGDPALRIAAIREIWDDSKRDYSGFVLTAYAAARITPSEDLADDAADLIASMLTAGLDADALSWAQIVPQGSKGWALLSLAQPSRANPVNEGQVDSFVSDDDSEGQRKSAFLVAGLAGLGRIDNATRDSLDASLSLDLARQTKWSQLITRAADVNNPALVAYLAAVGMQGQGWDKMTARHLYHIVSALNRAGMSAEARMIAAEAVARG